MNKLGHLLFATFIFTIIYVIVSNNINLENEKILISFIIFLIYSLIPDIDKNNSWIRNQLDKIILLLLIFFTIISIVNNDKIALFIAIILIAAEVILTLIKHRGPLHSFTFGLIVASPLLLIDPIYFFSGFIGVLTHLIADKI